MKWLQIVGKYQAWQNTNNFPGLELIQQGEEHGSATFSLGILLDSIKFSAFTTFWMLDQSGHQQGPLQASKEIHMALKVIQFLPTICF